LITSEAASDEEAEDFRLMLSQGIQEAVSEGEQRLADANPAVRCIALLKASIQSGRSFLEVDGNLETPTPHGALRASAHRIGFVIGQEVLLIREAAFAAVQELARIQGNPMPETLDNIEGKLAEAKMLIATEKRRGAHSYTVRRRVNGKREYGWLLNASSIFGTDEEESE
jgi:hypothetical protein